MSTEGDEVQAEVTGSTVPRRQLGRYMRELRCQARLTVRVVARELEWSEGKIWRIEAGKSSMRSHDAQQLCRLYGASEQTTEALTALAGETRARGWWHSYGDVIPEYFDVYIGLEEAASEFCWYDDSLVPGLLQTESYARALFKADSCGMDDEEIDRRARVRVARVSLLTRTTAPPTLRAVVGEAALRRPMGGGEVMADQLDHLVRMNQLEHVQIRVMSFEVGAHAGTNSGPFITLRFPMNAVGQDSEPPTVYVESFTGALYLDRPSELRRYDAAWNSIWDSALDEPASVELMKQAARELRS